MNLIEKFNKLISERTIEITLTVLLIFPFTLTLLLMLSALITIMTVGGGAEAFFQFMMGFIFSLAIFILLLVVWKELT